MTLRVVWKRIQSDMWGKKVGREIGEMYDVIDMTGNKLMWQWFSLYTLPEQDAATTMGVTS